MMNANFQLRNETLSRSPDGFHFIFSGSGVIAVPTWYVAGSWYLSDKRVCVRDCFGKNCVPPCKMNPVKSHATHSERVPSTYEHTQSSSCTNRRNITPIKLRLAQLQSLFVEDNVISCYSNYINHNKERKCKAALKMCVCVYISPCNVIKYHVLPKCAFSQLSEQKYNGPAWFSVSSIKPCASA